jgi:dTDP-4-dehydrorhamnose reductase
MKSLELWGGYECTVNRVGDEWFDQTLRSGHEDRIEDLQLIADLGVKSVRYPALWERISPDRPDQGNFRWTDERLEEMHRLGLNPILTLCHHGSGPHYTSLIGDSFAPGLARHAAAVAARYPWVRDWTPVNEPLTTARFSALYGLWYPHTKDERSFWIALLNEIDATRLSMREIRKVNPDARLIQTDDLGYCHATPPLQAEADYQNQRRWIGWDLLFGRVTEDHPLWNRIASFGLADRLQTIANDPCPPDVIGINHYLSSERLMDHRVELYPHRSVADRQVAMIAGVPKIDVDAIRHREEGVLGLEALIMQAWERYGQTISITECHNGGTREDQVRWFVEVWKGAENLRAAGVDLCAVTAWSLLGSYDWNRMVTCQSGHYETGVFDVRTGTPRPTLLATVLKDLAEGRMPTLPAISKPGWWRRASRLIHGDHATGPQFEVDCDAMDATERPLLIVTGLTDLTELAVRACEHRGLPYVKADVANAQSVFARAEPWAVLDVSDPDLICSGQEGSGRAKAPPALAGTCAEMGVPFAFITGAQLWHPGEHAPGILEVRTSNVYAPWDQAAEAVQLLDALDAGERIEIDASKPWRGVYGPDAVDVMLDLLFDGVSGAVDLRNADRLSKIEFARQLAAVAEASNNLIVARGPLRERSAFSSAPSQSYLPPMPTTLERFVRERRRSRPVAQSPAADEVEMVAEAAE